jgi:hypothetical protein
VTKLLNDNGKEFADRFRGTGQRPPTGKHPFDQVRADHAIHHRLIVLQADVNDVGAPYLVGPYHRQPARTVRVDLVLRVGPAGARARPHAGQSQNPHQALHRLAVDCMPRFRGTDNYPPTAALERPTGVLGVDQT